MRTLILFLSLLVFGCGESHTPGDGTDAGTGRDTSVRFDSSIPVADSSIPPRTDGGPPPVTDSGRPGTDTGPPPSDDAGEPYFDLLEICIDVCDRGEACGASDGREDCIRGCLEVNESVEDERCRQMFVDAISCINRLDCMELINVFDGRRNSCTPFLDRFERTCGRDGMPPSPSP